MKILENPFVTNNAGCFSHHLALPEAHKFEVSKHFVVQHPALYVYITTTSYAHVSAKGQLMIHTDALTHTFCTKHTFPGTIKKLVIIYQHENV